MTLSAPQPQIVTWYKVYAAFMVVVYVLVFLAGIALLAIGPASVGATEAETTEIWVNAIACIVVGLPLAIVFGVALFLPRRPWAWIYGIVTICLSLTSCCCLPIAIPLLVFWIKPEVKQFYGMGGASPTPQDSI